MAFYYKYIVGRYWKNPKSALQWSFFFILIGALTISFLIGFVFLIYGILLGIQSFFWLFSYHAPPPPPILNVPYMSVTDMLQDIKPKIQNKEYDLVSDLIYSFLIKFKRKENVVDIGNLIVGYDYAIAFAISAKNVEKAMHYWDHFYETDDFTNVGTDLLTDKYYTAAILYAFVDKEKLGQKMLGLGKGAFDHNKTAEGKYGSFGNITMELYGTNLTNRYIVWMDFMENNYIPSNFFKENQ